jgi:N-acetylneuraminic acid mutarotase
MNTTDDFPLDPAAFFNVRMLLVPTAFFVGIFSTLLAEPSPHGHAQQFAPTSTSERTLTFAERVAYQTAIEDVYWRHRIWPEENASPKPSLALVMSEAQLEKKVTDYLSKSQALANYWHQPITAEQLQAEMDRMAKNTKRPEILGELFDALGNDPVVIAECLARPIVVQRLVTSRYSRDQRFHGAVGEPSLEHWRANTGNQMYDAMAVISSSYTLPTIPDAVSGCAGDAWTATTTSNAPAARSGHTAVWTGSEMIVWGGYPYISFNALNTGGIYNPATDFWTFTTTTNAPDGGYSHTAVWTGREMIVWSGDDSYPGNGNTGGKYNPSTDSWTTTSTINAPTARYGHTAVWTGSEMIVWGGTTDSTGGRYNPITNSWTATSTTNAPIPRAYHTAVWTGSEMIVWGGQGMGTNLNTGGRYDPDTDTWVATNALNATHGRYHHTAIWTGSEMIVWGGFDGASTYLNTGGRYNPDTNSWTATSTSNAPSARNYHTAVWTGSEMIVWGGFDGASAFNTGGAYDPSTDFWTATSSSNAPSARCNHTAVWTGSEMIVWGGTDGTSTVFNTGGIYCAQLSTPVVLGNISTRSFVQTGEDVMIGGFIVQGTGTKSVIIRAIGPELTQYGITNVLANPTLQLYNSAGALIGSNDNWQTTIIGGVITSNQVSDIQNSGHVPTNANESAIIANLAPGNYTAIVSGVSNTTGVALVEAYDLSPDTSSVLGNISTRGFVQTGADVMIGGFIVQGTGTKKVIIRAIGPELGAPPYNLPGALANPTLQLYNASGVLIGSNDNWQTTIIGGVITSNQVSDIQNSGHVPTNANESAIIANLAPGNYTAIVSGVSTTTGVALVEVYDLD